MSVRVTDTTADPDDDRACDVSGQWREYHRLSTPEQIRCVRTGSHAKTTPVCARVERWNRDHQRDAEPSESRAERREAADAVDVMGSPRCHSVQTAFFDAAGRLEGTLVPGTARRLARIFPFLTLSDCPLPGSLGHLLSARRRHPLKVWPI